MKRTYKGMSDLSVAAIVVGVMVVAGAVVQVAKVHSQRTEQLANRDQVLKELKELGVPLSWGEDGKVYLTDVTVTWKLDPEKAPEVVEKYKVYSTNPPTIEWEIDPEKAPELLEKDKQTRTQKEEEIHQKVMEVCRKYGVLSPADAEKLTPDEQKAARVAVQRELYLDYGISLKIQTDSGNSWGGTVLEQK